MNDSARIDCPHPRLRPPCSAGLDRLALAGVLLVAALGCARTPPPDPMAPVPMSARLYYDDGGGIQDSLRLVIRGADEWRQAWEQATSNRLSAPPPRPILDFEQEMAVVVATGRMNQGDQIRVDSVGVREERLASGEVEEVLAVIVRTIEGCDLFNAEAYPVEIVRVRQFEGPVRFIERREEPVNCG